MMIVSFILAEVNHYVTIDTLRIAADKAKIEQQWNVVVQKYLDISSLYQMTGDVDSLLYYSERAYEVSEQNKLDELMAHSLNHIGSYYNYTGDYSRALEYFHRALPLYMEEKDSLRVSSIYENIGKTHKDLGNYSNAITYLLKATQMLERNENLDIRPSIYTTLGSIFYRMKDYRSMLRYLIQSQQMLEDERVLTTEHAILFNEFGKYHDGTGDLKSAKKNFQKTVDISNEIGWKLGVSTGLSNLADIFYLEGDLDKALSNHLRILDIDREIENNYGIVKDFLFISEIYFDMSMFKTAEAYADSSLSIALDKGMAAEISAVLNLQSRIYQKQNRIKDAFDKFYLFYTYEDSLENIEYKKHLSDLSEKYQVAVNERRLLEEQTEKKMLKQRSLLLLYALITMIMIILTVIVLSFQRNLKNRYRTLMLKQQLFRAQMNPHFIFNSLSAIQHYILKNKTSLAAEFLGAYSRLMRLILESSDCNLISLEKELDIVRIQLELEKLRFGDKFVYKLDIQEDIEFEDLYVPPMLLQPLVENSIKHGFSDINYQGEIYVSVCYEDNKLTLIETDNGSGTMSQEFYKKSHALSIMKQRLELLKNVKNIDTELNVCTNQSKGIKTEIIIHNPEKLIQEL